MRTLTLLTLLLLQACASIPPTVESAPITEIRNVHRVGQVYLAGQPTAEGLAGAKALGTELVINLRSAGEKLGYDESAAAAELGMRYESLGFRAPETLTDEIFDRTRELLDESDGAVLLHCGSANRVGAVWLPYRVLDQGVPVYEALNESREIGLKTLGYEAKALDYIERNRSRHPRITEASVKPGINESFLAPEVDLEKMTGRFEGESREVYVERQAIIDHLEIAPGTIVADVGAGTGLFLEALAEAVGPEGKLLELDIAPDFVKHLRARAERGGYDQVEALLCGQDAIYLAPKSVDLALVCDVYHHFEFPEATMRSIHRALRPGGEVVIIDFDRIPGVTREWLMNHVRAGKDEVLAELDSYGFKLVEEIEVDGIEENYIVRLRKR